MCVRVRARTHTHTHTHFSFPFAAFIPMRNDAGQGHHRLYRRNGCSLTAEMLVVVEALLAECLVTVLTLTSQGLTDICAHFKVRIVRHMVSSCDLLSKANWDPKVITQVSTVAIQPQKEKGDSS